MSVDSTGLGNGYQNPYQNPQLMQQYAAANNDLMANLHFNEIEKSGRIPGLTETAGSTSFCGGPETDTFEKSSSGPGLAGTVGLATAGGLTGGAGGYWLLSNPIKDLKEKTLNADFYKAIDKADLGEEIKAAQAKLKNTKGYNLAQLAKAKSFDELPDEVKTFLKNNNLDKISPEEAKGLIEATGKKVDDFELNKVAERVTKKFKGTQHYNNIIKASTDGQILKNINEAKNLDELKAVILKNKDFFEIKGTEAEIAQKVEALAAKGKTAVADDAGKIITNAEDFVLKKKSNIFKNIGTDGKLLESADDATKALFKDFKWQQAKKYGKWGAIVAGGLAVLYGLFGGNSQKA